MDFLTIVKIIGRRSMDGIFGFFSTFNGFLMGDRNVTILNAQVIHLVGKGSWKKREVRNFWKV